MDREHRRLRLAETIAWCSSQPLDASAGESDRIRRRRRLFTRSVALSNAAWALKSNRFLRWFTTRKRERLDQTPQLRTASLKPDTEFSSRQNEAERAAIVELLCEKRAALLRQAGATPRARDIAHAKGKILLYAPDENLCDGASQVASWGFFDVDNTPPWDSWVCFDGIYLVCWVDSAFLGPASKGVDVNAEGCIEWVKDLFGGI